MNLDTAMKTISHLLANKNNEHLLDDIVNFLYQHFDYYTWVGIYIVKNNTLLLGPWRGKQETEHIQIPIGTGICGSAAQTGKTEIIPDVNKDPRYLSCFVSTSSEIVVPIKNNNQVIGEIDIDSDVPHAFNEKDKLFLEKIASNEFFISAVEQLR